MNKCPLIRVYDCPGLFPAVTFGLDWITDGDIAAKLATRYKFYALAIPDDALTLEQLQLTADGIREQYNKLYENLHLPFNPLYNVDAYESFTEEKTGDAAHDGKSAQYPMDSAGARDVLKTTDNNKSNEKIVHTNRRYGNIGVTKSTDLIESANNMLRNLIFDYMAEFGDWFMITTWGEW